MGAVVHVDLTQGELAGRIVSMQADWQLVSLAMYGSPAAPRYAAIWHPGRKRPWTVAFDLKSASQIGAAQAAAEDEGYFPTIATGTGALTVTSAEPVRMAIVLEKFEQPPRAPVKVLYLPDATRKALGKQLTSTWEDAPSGMPADANPRALKWLPSSIDWFSVKLLSDPFSPPRYDHHYLAVVQPQPDPAVGFSVTYFDGTSIASVSESAFEETEEHRAMTAGWARPQQLVPSGVSQQGKVAMLGDYRTDSFAPWPASLKQRFAGGMAIAGPLRRNQVDAVVLNRVAEGWLPFGCRSDADAGAAGISAGGAGLRQHGEHRPPKV